MASLLSRTRSSNTNRTPVPLAPWCPSRTTPPLSGDSSTLITTPLAPGQAVRAAYLSLGPAVSPPPLLSASPFVSREMISHLMRDKRNTAIGAKFVPGSSITNMEGALHTFLTPVVKINMHGDYVFKGRHGVEPFKSKGGQQAREVVLSALVQPDFEGRKVMLALAALGSEAVRGRDLGELPILSVAEKQDASAREAYDARLREHMVYHLTANGLPTKSSVKAMSYDAAVQHVADGKPTKDCYVTSGSAVLSLELLYNSAVQQVVNEFSALEALCPRGYVYTFDPPAIFAKELGATLLNRLFISAVGHVVRLNPGRFNAMRAFGFNDYADRGAVGLLKAALRSCPHVLVVPKAQLFPRGSYVAPPGAEGALLVIHNNSDAFGQNIETEGDGGSLDGAIGCHSSAAASLHREHPGLVDRVLDVEARMKAK